MKKQTNNKLQDTERQTTLNKKKVNNQKKKLKAFFVFEFLLIFVFVFVFCLEFIKYICCVCVLQ